MIEGLISTFPRGWRMVGRRCAVTAAPFPDQHTGPLTSDELRALRLMAEASPAPLLVMRVLQQYDTAMHLGLELLRARGWVRLRGWPSVTRTRWEMTPRGLREAAAHPDFNGWGGWCTWWRIWRRALGIYLRGRLRDPATGRRT